MAARVRLGSHAAGYFQAGYFRAMSVCAQRGLLLTVRGSYRVVHRRRLLLFRPQGPCTVCATCRIYVGVSFRGALAMWGAAVVVRGCV